MMRFDVTVLNFDGTYHDQPHLLQNKHRWIDLSDLTQTNMYCPQETLAEIAKRMDLENQSCLTFIGSGNYHYVTYLFLQNMKEPCDLVLFDHHPDTGRPYPLLSCGSWVSKALSQLPLLQRVVIIGLHPKYSTFIPPQYFNRVRVVSTANLFKSSEAKILQWIKTDKVYISIDKDVLDPAFAATNWDQGNMSLSSLLEMLETISRYKQILGIDVCGELPYNPLGDMAYTQAVRKNERANQAIMDIASSF
ncbi:arginase family enzyme [Caldalkalibacillus uzonensis]|uniref:Arginase family enzyme n=1 Tax=Caldalkalibacillus uzonensis TaxID=353224 RepID=A0ABU0CN18_9BACI|nr:arginase family protein [Caldalkalibacillus uzonensis]MDQ0337809.1 arginase family enzyme [Caldalkalibacillus uzonensis]